MNYKEIDDKIKAEGNVIVQVYKVDHGWYSDHGVRIPYPTSDPYLAKRVTQYTNDEYSIKKKELRDIKTIWSFTPVRSDNEKIEKGIPTNEIEEDGIVVSEEFRTDVEIIYTNGYKEPCELVATSNRYLVDRVTQWIEESRYLIEQREFGDGSITWTKTDLPEMRLIGYLEEEYEDDYGY